MTKLDDHNPYQAPDMFRPPPDPAEDFGPLLHQLQAVDLTNKKQPWTLNVYSERLCLLGPDGLREDVTRDDLEVSARLYDWGFSRRSLKVQRRRGRTFQFYPGDYQTLKQWIGPPTVDQLRLALEGRFPYTIPLGGAMVGGALAPVVVALTTIGTSAGGIRPLRFRPVPFVLGCGLIATGVLSRMFPHRLFFLFDSFCFAVLSLVLAHGIWNGLNWLWGILILVGLFLISDGIRQYRHFADVRHGSP